MLNLAEKYAFENVSTMPREIWEQISKEMSDKYTSYTGLSDKQVVNKVKNTRQTMNVGDIALLLENKNFDFVRIQVYHFCRKLITELIKKQKMGTHCDLWQPCAFWMYAR